MLFLMCLKKTDMITDIGKDTENTRDRATIALLAEMWTTTARTR